MEKADASCSAFRHYGESQLTAFNKLVDKSFPFVSTTLNPVLEYIQSESKTGTGATPPQIISNESGGGDLTAEMLPSDVPYYILAALNTDSADYTNRDPLSVSPLAGTDVAVTALTTGNVSTAASGDFPDIVLAPYSSGMFSAALTMTFSVATAAAGTIRIIGARANGIAATEVKPFSKTYNVASGSTTFTFDGDSWAQIHRVIFSGFGSATGTATLTVGPSVKKRTFKQSSTNTQSAGLTIQGILDEIPFVMPSAIVNLFGLQIGTTVRATLGFLGANCYFYRMIHSDSEYFSYDTTVTDAALTNFPEPPLDFYTPLGGLIEVGNSLNLTEDFSAIGTTPIRGRDLNVEINHNYETATGFTGVLGGGRPVDSDTGRVVSAVATIDFASGNASDTFIQWQSDARNNVKRAVRSRFFWRIRKRQENDDRGIDKKRGAYRSA